MNDSTQTLTATQTKAIRRTCPKCKDVRETSEVICPVCGESLHSVNRIKLNGGLLIVMGIGLLGFMGWLALWMLNATQTGRSTYHGTPGQTVFIAFVVGLVVLISLNATAAGIWQLIFGRRSKPLMITMSILAFGFLAAGFAAFLSK